MQHRFLLQILLLAQHVSGNTMPIIRSSKVLYSGCCLWYLVLWFSSCWSVMELRVMCLVCRMLLTCFGHHYAHHQELKSIIQWFLPVVFGAVVFKLLVWCGAEGYVSCLQDAGCGAEGYVSGLQDDGCGAEGYVSGLQDAAAPRQNNNLKTTTRNTTGSNQCIILLSS